MQGRYLMRQSLDPSRVVDDYDFVHRLRARFAETDAMGSSTMPRTCRTWSKPGWLTYVSWGTPMTRCAVRGSILPCSKWLSSTPASGIR